MRRRILAACMAMCMAAATVVTSPWGGGMTAYAAEETKTITVSAYDYTAVDAGIEGASKTGVIMEQTVEVDADTTTTQAVQKAFDQAGVSVEGVSSGYVSSINGLGAGVGYSGWMLAYDNDDYSNWGMSSIALSDGDSLRFDYTCNEDTTTDDIGNGYYGNPYVKTLTVAGQTFNMSKKTTFDANYNMTNTYYINGEETKAAGTEEDPFVFEVYYPNGSLVLDEIYTKIGFGSTAYPFVASTDGFYYVKIKGITSSSSDYILLVGGPTYSVASCKVEMPTVNMANGSDSSSSIDLRFEDALPEDAVVYMLSMSGIRTTAVDSISVRNLSSNNTVNLSTYTWDKSGLVSLNMPLKGRWSITYGYSKDISFTPTISLYYAYPVTSTYVEDDVVIIQ